jgi:hypothetical protein
MSRSFNDQFHKGKTAYKMGFGLSHSASLTQPKGTFILTMTDSESGEVLEHWVKDNVITHDAGILAARLFRDNVEPNHGVNMLSVGTGATGALLSPDAPSADQRRLNNEIARKGFSSTTFRNQSGVAVAYPTNIVDFTTTFGEAEAVGPLNEMGLLCTISDNVTVKNPNPNAYPLRDTTLDITQYDVLVNYLTFSVVTKPSTAILTITWRLTF